MLQLSAMPKRSSATWSWNSTASGPGRSATPRPIRAEADAVERRLPLPYLPPVEGPPVRRKGAGERCGGFNNDATGRPAGMTRPESRLAALLFAFLAIPGGTAAEPVTVDGVTFSDEAGGFRLLSVSGSGTEEDPFLVVEEITDPGDAVLVIRGAPEPTARNPRRNRILSGHEIGFAIRKVAVNATAQIWTGFDLELQASPGMPSPWRDGLSFGQGSAAQKRTRSDAFERTTILAEPIDSIVYALGDVMPGGSATLDFVITDMTLRPEIRLVQRRNRPLSGLVPDPAPEPVRPASGFAARRVSSADRNPI